MKSKELTDDLENKISQKLELIRRLEAKLKEKEDEMNQFQKEYQVLLQQLECIPETNIKQLEELSEQHIITAAMIDQVKNEIYEVEKLVISRTRELENIYLPVVSSEYYTHKIIFVFLELVVLKKTSFNGTYFERHYGKFRVTSCSSSFFGSKAFILTEGLLWPLSFLLYTKVSIFLRSLIFNIELFS